MTADAGVESETTQTPKERARIPKDEPGAGRFAKTTASRPKESMTGSKQSNDAASISNKNNKVKDVPKKPSGTRRIESAEDFSNTYKGRIEFRRNGQADFDTAFGKKTSDQKNIRGARGELIEAMRLLEHGHPVHGRVEKLIILPAPSGKKTPDFAVKYDGKPGHQRVEVTSKVIERPSSVSDLTSAMNNKGKVAQGTNKHLQLDAPLEIKEGPVFVGDTLVINAFKGTEPGAIASAVAKKGPELIDAIKFIQFNRPKKGTDPSRKLTLDELETIVYARDKNGKFRIVDPKYADE